MLDQKALSIGDLELVYLNGQEHGGAPIFKDVRLSRDSQISCEELLQLAKQHDKRIRSENECEKCLLIEKDLKARIAALQWLRQKEREAWVRILTQINEGIVPIETQL